MTDTTSPPPHDEAASHEAPAEHKGFSFADMHLAVGDRLQIEKLFVRVSQRWRDDPDYYQQWGLDYKA